MPIDAGVVVHLSHMNLSVRILDHIKGFLHIRVRQQAFTTREAGGRVRVAYLTKTLRKISAVM